MKLLQKTTLYYLVYSLFIFIIGSVLFYYLVRIVLLDSIDDALHQEKLQLIANLDYEKIDKGIKPSAHVVIEPVKGKFSGQDKYSTEVIYDPIRGEYEDYRQIESYHRNKDQWYRILIQQNLTEAEYLMKSILPVELGLFLILLIGVLLMNSFVLNKIWQPFYTLMDKLRKYELSKSKVIKYEHAGIDEFRELNLSVEKMTERIYNDFQRQKEFIENSSHELQTPLAIIRNKLELLIQSKNLSESDMELVERIFEAVTRLSNLNKNLLLLSKIENRQFSEREEIEVALKVSKSLSNLEEQLKEKNISVNLEITNPCKIYSNKILVEIMINNLLTNAIRHNFSDGKIFIKVSDRTLVIENTGKPLSSSPDEMFQRFKKSSGSENSIGLGLNIVKKICEYFDYEVSYQTFNTLHVFKISFN
ncbi:MAG: sensor histidine kinase [Cytophagaceae bacterium]